MPRLRTAERKDRDAAAVKERILAKKERKKTWLPPEEYRAKQAEAKAGAKPKKTEFHDYSPRGAAQQLFGMHDREIILDGPAGTGKSRGCLEKVNYIAEKYKGARCCMVR